MSLDPIFTDNQIKILIGISQGFTQSQIARAYGWRPGYVHNEIPRIREKWKNLYRTISLLKKYKLMDVSITHINESLETFFEDKNEDLEIKT